jgi:hypothetical protein
MTWAGIVACQMGAAFAVRTSRASLRQVGLLTNRHLLRGVAFAATIIYAPPAAIDLQDRRIASARPARARLLPGDRLGLGRALHWRMRKHANAAENGPGHGERPSC